MAFAGGDEPEAVSRPPSARVPSAPAPFDTSPRVGGYQHYSEAEQRPGSAASIAAYASPSPSPILALTLALTLVLTLALTLALALAVTLTLALALTQV